MRVKKVKKVAKFDDLQIKNGALDQDGKFIAAQIEVMRRYEAAAEEKAGHELKKAEENRATIEKRLADVHAKCTRGGFTAFKAKYAPDFGRTKLYQALAIGSGKKTRDQVRAEDAARQRNKRAADKEAEASVTQQPVTDNSPREYDPRRYHEAVEQGKEAEAAMEIAKTTMDAPPAEPKEAPPAGPVEIAEAPPVAPAPTDEERADDALAAFKKASWALLPFPAERETARKWFLTDFAKQCTKQTAKERQEAA